MVITGATGFVGSSLLRNAQSRGMKVVPVVRSASKSVHMGISNCVLFREMTARKLLDTNCGMPSVMVHLAGSSRDERGCSIWDSVVATTRVVVSVSREAGIKRLIYLSGFGATSRSTEVYFRAKAEAEKLICRSGIPHVILRCSYVLGPGDELTPHIQQQLKRGRVEIPGDGLYRFQPVYVEDLIGVIIKAACIRGRRSHSYHLLGPTMSYLSYVKLLAARLAPKADLRHVKLEALIRRAVFSNDPAFTTGELAVLVCDAVGPVTKTCLGVRIRGIEKTVDSWINPAPVLQF